MFTLQTSFKPILLNGAEVKSVSRCDCEQQGGKLLRLLSKLRPKIRPLLSYWTAACPPAPLKPQPSLTTQPTYNSLLPALLSAYLPVRLFSSQPVSTCLSLRFSLLSSFSVYTRLCLIVRPYMRAGPPFHWAWSFFVCLFKSTPSETFFEKPPKNYLAQGPHRHRNPS